MFSAYSFFCGTNPMFGLEIGFVAVKASKSASLALRRSSFITDAGTKVPSERVMDISSFDREKQVFPNFVRFFATLSRSAPAFFAGERGSCPVTVTECSPHKSESDGFLPTANSHTADI